MARRFGGGWPTVSHNRLCSVRGLCRSWFLLQGLTRFPMAQEGRSSNSILWKEYDVLLRYLPPRPAWYGFRDNSGVMDSTPNQKLRFQFDTKHLVSIRVNGSFERLFT